MDPLEAVSPIDGRYRKYTEPLARFFNEAAGIRYHIIMEGEFLIALSETGKTGLRSFTEEEKAAIRDLYDFTTEEARVVHGIEVVGANGRKATNHDFKAIEYFIKDKLAVTTLQDCVEWVHFGLTSQDTIHIAHTLMIAECLRDVYIPALEDVAQKIGALADSTKNIPILARTHGQPASPTTFGKEFRIFHARLLRQLEQLKKHKLQAKLNGATGNNNALVAAYPNVDWIEFSRAFIERLNTERKVDMEVNLLTTQIEPYDSYAELFDTLRRVNTILIGFDQDVWRYISDGWIVQKPVEGEVGSSTMPHKINPWFLENSEGNLGLANAIFGFFSTKLPISRLQRDLSDSTVMRNVGVAFGHSLVGLAYLANQLGRISVDEEMIKNDLDAHPEVIAEAIQTILRREGVALPYEQLKALTRGKQVTLQDFASFIDGLTVSDKVKKELKAITPQNYTGLAAKLAGPKD